MDEPRIEDLYPELDEEALTEAVENLRRYAALIVRMYKRHLLNNTHIEQLTPPREESSVGTTLRNKSRSK